MCGMNPFQNGSRCITLIMKLNLLWLVISVSASSKLKTTWWTWCISINSSSVGSSSTSSPHHSSTTAHPQPNKVLITLTLSYQNVCQITRESRGWEPTTAEAWCTGKHGGPKALIKTTITPPRRTHVHTLLLSLSRLHAKSSLGLSASGSGIHLQALLLALL